MTNAKLITLVNEKFSLDIRTKCRDDYHTFARMVFYSLSKKLIKFQTIDQLIKEIRFNRSTAYNSLKRFDQIYHQVEFEPYKNFYLQTIKSSQ